MSMPSSTTMTVHPVTLTPYASASRTPCAPGNDGSSAGWVLTIRPPNRPRNVAPNSFMNPASTTRSGENTATVSAIAASHAARSSKSLTETTAVGMPASRAMSSARMFAAVRDHRDDARAVGGVVVGGQQRRQVRAGAGDEDHEPTRRAGGRGGALGRLVRHAPTLPARRRHRCGRPVRRSAVRGRECTGEQPVRAPGEPSRHPGRRAALQHAPVWPPAGAPQQAAGRPGAPAGGSRGHGARHEPHAAVRRARARVGARGHAAGCPGRLPRSRSRSRRSSSASARSWSQSAPGRAALAPLLAVGLVIALSWTLLLSVQLALWPAQQEQAGVPRAAP